MTRHAYRCDDCHTVCEHTTSVWEGGARYDGCYLCEGNVARVTYCSVCDTREAECGCEECIECIADAVEDFCQMDEAGLEPVADGRHA